LNADGNAGVSEKTQSPKKRNMRRFGLFFFLKKRFSSQQQ